MKIRVEVSRKSTRISQMFILSAAHVVDSVHIFSHCFIVGPG